MHKILKRFLNEEQGVTAIEYALIAGLIAVAVVGSLQSVTTALKNVFTSIVTALGLV
ncbi:MAG: Flp/Fap pilin component [Paraburkholderia sp.]|jgi:pilus assembly protein Flp/PilA|nr:Flp/Fap pilin component [Paraburkholderia sp.]MEA3122011.1 Flp/Fap pilin component [Paraburkholderia sp.]